jgi:TPR repeat protein
MDELEVCSRRPRPTVPLTRTKPARAQHPRNHNMPPCAACARDGAGALCGGCRFAAYCGAACQRGHWAAHKAVCKAIKELIALRGPGWEATTCDACASTLVGVGQRCSGCYSVEYCDAACQLAHWKREHKAACKAVGEARFARLMVLATAGVAAMMHNVALAYAKGMGVAVDLCKSFEWYRRAADAGIVEAQLNVATFYSDGKGVDVDPRAAFEWYRRAAEAGHVGAQYNLAHCYESGTGIAADPRAAIDWYCRAAEAGYVNAMFNLGCIYMNGAGDARDLREARRWFERAAAAGIAPAKAVLAKLDALEAQ